jgi:hypothetical protein
VEARQKGNKMNGLEVLTGNCKLNILQCQEFAKDSGFNSIEFDLCGPSGKLKCRWLDAYFGVFEVIEKGKESDGFLSVQQFKYNTDIWCEIIKPAALKKKEVGLSKTTTNSRKKARKASTQTARKNK